MFVLPEMVELSRDEEVGVRCAAMEAIVDLIPLLDEGRNKRRRRRRRERECVMRFFFLLHSFIREDSCSTSDGVTRRRRDW